MASKKDRDSGSSMRGSAQNKLESLKKFQNKLKKAPRKIQSKIQAQLNEKIGDKISAQISSQLNSKLAQRINEQAQGAMKQATRTAHIAAEKAQMAAESARHGLDQVLINLEHRGLNIKESQDLAMKVGRKVLERAEVIRAQIAANPLSPAWLKDVSLATPEAAPSQTEPPVVSNVSATEANSMTETTVSEAAEGVCEPTHPEREAADVAILSEEGISEKKPRREATQKKSASTTGARLTK